VDYEIGGFKVDLLLIDSFQPIEVKGGSHVGVTQERKDQWKDKEIVKLGFPKPLWFTDQQVIRDLNMVIDEIKETIK